MHAHISIQSADCDGRYDRSYVLTPIGDEDEWEFRAMIIGNVTAYSTNGTVTFSPEGFTFDEPTDEGYVHTGVTWCEDDNPRHVGMPSTFRDHTAEGMGY